MSFAVVAIATSAAGLLLGLGWLFAGQVMLRPLKAINLIHQKMAQMLEASR
jgi:hypothetical protein